MFLRPLILGMAMACLAFAEASAPAGPEWVRAELRQRLAQPPLADLDKTIADLIENYQGRLAKLDPASPIVRPYLAHLRNNVILLYREYNQDHNRYPADCFPAKACIAKLQYDMKLMLEQWIEKGHDPMQFLPGRCLCQAYWIERLNILGQYDVIVPEQYVPGQAYPAVLSYQDDPDSHYVRRTPFFLIRAFYVGYPQGWWNIECKTRSILKDVSSQFNIDPCAIYATGFSFGGHTALCMGWRYPHWFAAIAPVNSDLRDYKISYVRYLTGMPTLLLYGDRDYFLLDGRSIFQMMKDAGCCVRFHVFPGGHDTDVPFFSDIGRMLTFFNQYRMNPYPRRVNRIIENPRYGRAFWVNASLESNKTAKATINVEIKPGNRIEIASSPDVAQVDLYLCDKLVEMDQPLTVQANDKVIFEGMPARKLTLKLSDATPFIARTEDTLWQELNAIRAKAHFTGRWDNARLTTLPASQPASQPAETAQQAAAAE